MAAENKRPPYATELVRVLRAMFPDISGTAEMTLHRPQTTSNVIFMGLAPCRILVTWPGEQSIINSPADLSLDISSVSLSNDTWQMLTTGKPCSAYFTDLFDCYTVRAFTIASAFLGKITFGEFVHTVARERFSFDTKSTVSAPMLFEKRWRVLVTGAVGVWLTWRPPLIPIRVPPTSVPPPPPPPVSSLYAAAVAAAAVAQVPPFPFHPGVPFSGQPMFVEEFQKDEPCEQQ